MRAVDLQGPCPLCGSELRWDEDDLRFECGGPVQHYFVAEGYGSERKLLLIATGSGEDAELYTAYPWPGATS